MTDEIRDWNARYAQAETPWDSGQPSQELQRILTEREIAPSRALELGCGTGTNAVFLAQRGFQVTACDISELAIERAKQRAAAAAVEMTLLAADIAGLPDLGPPFPFVFDRGLYHVVRKTNLEDLLSLLKRVTEPGSLWLTLAGNANETHPEDKGPPTVRAVEICSELEPLFELVQLREFHFDGVVLGGQEFRPLAWSVLLRRR
jgi:methyl halide transferase